MINFKFTNTESSDGLKTVLEQKLQSLEKFIGDETDVKCDVEFEKVTTSEHGPVYRVEVNLYVAGTMYRAEATLETFEEAIDEVRDELDKELRRNNKKHADLIKKGGRKIKEWLRFGRRDG